MARIKLFGVQELIPLENKDAKKVDGMWKDDEIDKESIISVGNFSATKKDIRFISWVNELEIDESTKRYSDEHGKYRNSLLELNPRARAKRIAWPCFNLFYFGLFRKKADENEKERVIEYCSNFFEEHEKWSKPSFLIWYDFLGHESRNRLMDRMTFNVISRIE